MKRTSKPTIQAPTPKRGRGRPRKQILTAAVSTANSGRIVKVEEVETKKLYTAPAVYKLTLDQRVAQTPSVTFMSRDDKRQLNRIEHMLKMVTKHQLSKKR